MKPAASRSLAGMLLMPDNTIAGEHGTALVELRDVSLQDAPSRVVASTRLSVKALAAGGQLAFVLEAPVSATGTALNLRAELTTPSATYLSTVACTVPVAGDAAGLQVPLTRVAG